MRASKERIFKLVQEWTGNYEKLKPSIEISHDDDYE